MSDTPVIRPPTLATTPSAEVVGLRLYLEQLAEMCEHAVLVVHGPQSIEAASIRNILKRRRGQGTP